VLVRPSIGTTLIEPDPVRALAYSGFKIVGHINLNDLGVASARSKTGASASTSSVAWREVLPFLSDRPPSLTAAMRLKMALNVDRSFGGSE
jgi:hypothetical protein